MSEQVKPTWVMVVGIMMIVFGALGVLGGLQDIIFPSVFDMSQEEQEAFKQLRENELSGENLEGEQLANEILESVEEVLDFPEWYSTWLQVSGSVNILISIFYLLVGVWLITIKPFAIRAVHFIMPLSIIWAIVQAIVVIRMDNLIMLGQVPGSVMSILIDIGLWITVMVCDKKVFRPSENVEPVETSA